MSQLSEYVAHGFALVPIPKGKKGPTKTGWNVEAEVIRDRVKAEHAITGNVGLAHAYCAPVPTAALDIDKLDHAVAWLLERGIDLQKLLDADDAVQVVSGRVGRAKLLYTMPADIGALESLTVKHDREGSTILEFRCATSRGLTVQDVLPPSIHPDTGALYTWGGKGNWRHIPEIPAALLQAWQRELLAKAQLENVTRPFPLSSKRLDDTPRQRARVMTYLQNISADCSYEIYRDVVWVILSLGWTDSISIAEAWCMTAPHRFEPASFASLLNSYDPARSPSVSRLESYARAGGCHG